MINDYVKSDLVRLLGKYNSKLFIKALCFNSTFRFLYIFRMSQAHRGNLFWKICYKLNRTRKYIQLPLQTTVGYGLYIGHGGPIVVNPTTIIGNNVNLSQFTTIGANEGQAAVIGDNTYIGPNVCIIENVHIGNNVTIGAGSVVTKDIPDNATAVGNYAKVINYNNPGRFVNNRWEVEQGY